MAADGRTNLHFNSVCKTPVFFLMGPTAAGKTATALALAAEFPFDIVSVDAAQVYRGMDIGTAKPDAPTLQRHPHRLIDVCDPWQAYSAGQFRTDALREIHEITSRGRVPLLVGGAMFYFHALEHGLSSLPSASERIRDEIKQRAHASDWSQLHAELAVIDPLAAAKISPNDAQRIQRLLELNYIESQTSADLMRQNKAERLLFDIVKIAICKPTREQLRRLIAKRFERMLELGLLAEAEKLYQAEQFNASLPAMRLVGYKQLWEYFAGSISYSQMKESAIRATSAVAKRQLTWIRNSGNVIWSIRADGADFSAIRNLVREVLGSLAPQMPR